MRAWQGDDPVVNLNPTTCGSCNLIAGSNEVKFYVMSNVARGEEAPGP